MPKKKSEIMLVTFIRENKKILWKTWVNGMTVIWHSNSKGRAPKSYGGAKNSFHYWAKQHKLARENYEFVEICDGICVKQQRLNLI